MTEAPASAPLRLDEVRLDEVRLDEAAGNPERGDVPGWVMVTLMTAGLVVLLWGVAGGALQGLFQQAIRSVSGL